MSDETIKTVAEWVREAGQILGVDADLSDEGACTLLIGNECLIAIEVPDEGEWYYLYTPVGALPKDDMESAFLLCQRALELNAFQAKTQGGAIGIVPGQSLLIYSMVRPVEGQNAAIFAETISLFHEAASELKDQLMQGLL